MGSGVIRRVLKDLKSVPWKERRGMDYFWRKKRARVPSEAGMTSPGAGISALSEAQMLKCQSPWRHQNLHCQDPLLNIQSNGGRKELSSSRS